MIAMRALLRSTGGATAAEFGLLAPLLLSFLIGTIDVGRFLWTCNRAERRRRSARASP
jgi:Flp pilus assembly protein TadG